MQPQVVIWKAFAWWGGGMVFGEIVDQVMFRDGRCGEV